MRWRQINALELKIEQLAPEVVALINYTATNRETTPTIFWEGVDKQQFLAYAFVAINIAYIEQRKRTAEATVRTITEILDGLRNNKYNVIVAQKRRRFGFFGKLRETSRAKKNLTASEINKILQAGDPLEEVLKEGRGYEQYNRDFQENQRGREGYSKIRCNLREALTHWPDLRIDRSQFSKEINYKNHFIRGLSKKSTGLSESSPTPIALFAQLELLAKVFPAEFLNLWGEAYSPPQQNLPFNYRGQGTAFEQLRELYPGLYGRVLPAETIPWKPILTPTQPTH